MTAQNSCPALLVARLGFVSLLAIVFTALSPRVVQGLIAVTTFVPLYCICNVLVVAWIRREWEGWRRSTKAFALRQIRPLTAARVRTTGLAHVIAFCTLISGFHQRLEIVEAALLLLVYVVLVAGLTLSLLAQMPAFSRLWSDVFTRILLLGAPFVLAYIMKGYSQMWLEETLAVGADNAPMAHFAGTVMMAGIAASSILLQAAIAFEVAMFIILMLPNRSEQKRRRRNQELKTEGKQELGRRSEPSTREMCMALFWSRRIEGSAEARAWRPITRRLGLFSLFSFSFLGCIVGVQAALTPFGTGFGKVLLAAIAFDFDAAPAGHCRLSEEEALEAAGREPKLKALMLSTSQEKAVLVTRSPKLFEPVVLKILSDEVESRKLDIGRTTACFEALPSKAP